jgi:hypothetical protein
MRAQRLVAYGTMLTVTLTVTGANTGEPREPQDSRIRLRQAVFETLTNSGEPSEINPGLVGLGSGTSPAVPQTLV